MGVSPGRTVGVNVLPIGRAGAHRDAKWVVGAVRAVPRKVLMDNPARCMGVGCAAVSVGRVDPRKTCHEAQPEEGQHEKSHRKISAAGRSAPTARFCDTKTGPAIESQCGGLPTGEMPRLVPQVKVGKGLPASASPFRRAPELLHWNPARFNARNSIKWRTRGVRGAGCGRVPAPRWSRMRLAAHPWEA